MKKAIVWLLLLILLLSAVSPAMAAYSLRPEEPHAGDFVYPKNLIVPAETENFKAEYKAPYTLYGGGSDWEIILGDGPKLIVEYYPTRKALYGARLIFKYWSKSIYVLSDYAEVYYKASGDNSFTLDYYHHGLYLDDKSIPAAMDSHSTYNGEGQLWWCHVQRREKLSDGRWEEKTYHYYGDGVGTRQFWPLGQGVTEKHKWYVEEKVEEISPGSWLVAYVPCDNPPADLVIAPPLKTMEVLDLTASGQETVKGDLDGDGTVDGKDLLKLAKQLLGASSGIDADAADVNGDGAVDGRDLLRMARYMAGKIAELK